MYSRMKFVISLVNLSCKQQKYRIFFQKYIMRIGGRNECTLHEHRHIHVFQFSGLYIPSFVSKERSQISMIALFTLILAWKRVRYLWFFSIPPSFLCKREREVRYLSLSRERRNILSPKRVHRYLLLCRKNGQKL